MVFQPQNSLTSSNPSDERATALVKHRVRVWALPVRSTLSSSTAGALRSKVRKELVLPSPSGYQCHLKGASQQSREEYAAFMDKHILVVEDDYLISGMLRDLLEGEGYHVVCVPTVALAMHILGSADEHPVDLIVLDLQLPDGYGLDFLKRFRASGNLTRPSLLSRPVYHRVPARFLPPSNISSPNLLMLIGCCVLSGANSRSDCRATPLTALAQFLLPLCSNGRVSKEPFRNKTGGTLLWLLKTDLQKIQSRSTLLM